MDDVDKITIISNRSGAILREKVMRELSSKLNEGERAVFERKNPEAKNFPSGEVYVQLQENVRRRRVHVIAGFYRPELYQLRKEVLKLNGANGNSSIGEKIIKDYLHSAETDFMELLKILDAARRSGAEEISVYLSYFPDSRQDKKDEPRVPISAKLKFDQLVSAGEPKLSRIGVIDIHAKQEQAFTNFPVDHITAKSQLILATKIEANSADNLTLVCADTNDYKSMKKFSDQLGLGLAVILKSRKGHNQIEDESHIEGDEVEGKVCVIVDDMIDTAGTVFKAVDVVMSHGAKRVLVCTTHGIFSPTFKDGKLTFVEDRFREANRKYGLKVITTDTIARSLEYLRENRDWLKVISVAPMLADLIYCNETGSSHGAKLDSYTELAKRKEILRS